MKKQLLVLLLTLLPMLAMADRRGECGDNVTWTYTESTKTLTIQGSGAMEYYTRSSQTPWYDFRTNIQIIVIEDGVTSIGRHAFDGCSGLTSVTIPNSVTSIEEDTFRGCSGLTSITIPNSVTSIGEGAFSGCSGLTSITIPNSVTSIGSSAFYGCSGLTSIKVENGNSKFDSRNNCNGIIETATNTLIKGFKNTIIPNSVTSIGSRAFWGCSGLTSITIPNSVTSIGDWAFAACLGLTSIIIPNSVTSIGDQAFEGCSGLTSITIPNSVTSLGGGAFYGCSGLQWVYSKIENVFAIDWSTFSDDTYYYAKLYVPIGKKSAYQETEGWGFYNIKEYDYSTGIAAPQQSKGAKIADAYQLNGQKLSGVQRGLNIVRMSDGTTKKVVVK